MSHEQISSTDHHRNMEGVRSERLGNGPAFARRPPDRQTLGGRALGLALRQSVRKLRSAHWEKSTAPKHPKRALWGEAAAEVRRWREATGFCREKLAVLAQAQGLEVSASTIHRYLQRVGLVRPSTKRRRPRFQNGQVMRPRNCPGGYLQMDVKYVTPELLGCRTLATCTRRWTSPLATRLG